MWKQKYEILGCNPLEGFPEHPKQDDVWQWLCAFQENHFDKARGVYHATEGKSNFVGPYPSDRVPDRQFDIMIKHREAVAGEKHDMADVLVVGELTVSDIKSAWREKWIQLTTYVRDIFIAQATRLFVHGFLLFNTTMELWIFDRTGAYSSNTFDIREQPERYLQVIAGYVWMSDEEWGLNTYIKKREGHRSIEIKAEATSKPLVLDIVDPPIAMQQAIVCRGTSCYLTEDLKHVVKFSWADDQRPPEAGHLRRARKNRVKGVA